MTALSSVTQTASTVSLLVSLSAPPAREGRVAHPTAGQQKKSSTRLFGRSKGAYRRRKGLLPCPPGCPVNCRNSWAHPGEIIGVEKVRRFLGEAEMCALQSGSIHELETGASFFIGAQKVIEGLLTYTPSSIASLSVFALSFSFSFFFFFLERGEGREKEKRNIDVWLPLTHPPTGDVACNPGMCPDWESNQ